MKMAVFTFLNKGSYNYWKINTTKTFAVFTFQNKGSYNEKKVKYYFITVVFTFQNKGSYNCINMSNENLQLFLPFKIKAVTTNGIKNIKN